MEVRSAWKMWAVDEEDYKPTSSWALKHLKKYLEENGIKEFETVFQRKLEVPDGAGFVYLLRTNKEFVLAKVTSRYIVETETMSVVIDVWAIETPLAKQIAGSILGRQASLDEWVGDKVEVTGRGALEA